MLHIIGSPLRGADENRPKPNHVALPWKTMASSTSTSSSDSFHFNCFFRQRKPVCMIYRKHLYLYAHVTCVYVETWRCLWENTGWCAIMWFIHLCSASANLFWSVLTVDTHHFEAMKWFRIQITPRGQNHRTLRISQHQWLVIRK